MSRAKDLMTAALRRYPRLGALLCLAGLCLIAYANSLPNSFHFDDIEGIVRNPLLKDLRYIPRYFLDPSTLSIAHAADWRPILQTTYALNYAIGGLNPTLYRLFNLLLHLGTAFLIFLIAAEVEARLPRQPLPGASFRAEWPAWLSAALFAVHTANSEAVNYIWARSSVLSAFFYLLSFYCFLRGPFGPEHGRKLSWHMTALGVFALALGSKATAMTLPAMLALYEALLMNPRGVNPLKLYRTEPRRLAKYIPIAVVFLAFLALRIALLPGFVRSAVAARAVDSSTYLLTQFRAWVYYIRLYLWPHPLIADFRGFGWSFSFDINVAVSLGIVAAILLAAWRARRDHPLSSFFTFWFFVALLPEAGFIPLGDAVVGYRPYLAYAGLSVAIAAALARIAERTWPGRHDGRLPAASRAPLACGVASLALIGSLATATIARNADWRDERTLWNDVLRKDPGNPRAYMALGVDYFEAKDYARAREMFEQAARVAPASAAAHMYLGYLNLMVDRHEEALGELDASIRLDPRNPYNYFYRAELYRKMERHPEAVRDYQAALRRNRYFPDAYYGLARVLWLMEDISGAVEACAGLMEADALDGRGYGCMGSLLMEQDRPDEAIQILKKGTARVPHDGKLWYSLGLAYERSGLYRDAQDAFEKAGSAAR